MPTLPKNLTTPARAVVTAVMLFYVRDNSLYSAMDIAAALNTVTDIKRNMFITKKENATVLLRALTHPDPEVVPEYGEFLDGNRVGMYCTFAARSEQHVMMPASSKLVNLA